MSCGSSGGVAPGVFGWSDGGLVAVCVGGTPGVSGDPGLFSGLSVVVVGGGPPAGGIGVTGGVWSGGALVCLIGGLSGVFAFGVSFGGGFLAMVLSLLGLLALFRSSGLLCDLLSSSII